VRVYVAGTKLAMRYQFCAVMCGTGNCGNLASICGYGKTNRLTDKGEVIG